MKTIYHVPTEQYGFVEIEVEGTLELQPEMITRRIEQYRAISAQVSGGEGMLEAELDTWIYNMLLGKGNDADIYQKATPAQQKELHRIKRQLAKIKRNQDNLDID